VVGAALAGVRTVHELREAGFEGRITLIGAERHEPYDRPPLSKQVLSGAWPVARAALTTSQELAALDVEVRLGVAATAFVDSCVVLDDGERVPFASLVIATGVGARRLPGQPQSASVHVLRTLDDALALKANLEKAQSLLVVGGGFIGAEVAAVARTQGRDVTMVEALALPFARVLGETVAGLCSKLHRSHGVRIVTNARIARFADDGSAVGVELEGGLRLESDCVLVGVGTVPNTAWLSNSGVESSAGVPCDASGRVEGHPNIYAVGDVAAWHDPIWGERLRIEHWTSATEQARVVARTIVGLPAAAGALMLPYFWSDQYKTKLQLVGRPERASEVRLLAVPDKPAQVVGTYFEHDRLVAVVTFSAPHLLARFRGLVGDRAQPAAVAAMASQLGLTPIDARAPEGQLP
jgi:NADPH-dependent 2,4-dienoyl-CoA reductase/sulfur reductase-like enzyme